MLHALRCADRHRSRWFYLSAPRKHLVGLSLSPSESRSVVNVLFAGLLPRALSSALLCRSRTELSDPCTPHPVWLMHTRFPGVDGTVACLLNDSKGTLNLLYRNLIQQLRDISQSQNQGKTCSIHDLLFCLLIIIVTHCRRYSVVLLQFLISHCFCRASPGEPVRGVPMRCHVGIDFSCRRHCEYNTVPSTLLRVLLRCH
jgi:hypothetical protein